MGNLKRLVAVLVAGGLLLGVGCSSSGGGGAGGGALIESAVLLDWTPNTNHTGLYVALDQGWYEEEGLQMEIISPSESGAVQLVASGSADFGVSYQEEVTLARAAGIPVVSIAAVLQENTSAFASKKESNITRPRDFEGKRYGGWGSPIEEAVIRTMMEKDGGDFSKVEFINIGAADFFTSLERLVDFTWIYQGWDGVQADLMGIPLNRVILREFDEALDYYTPVLIVNEKSLSEQPDKVRAFLKATARGYEFAAEYPAEAAEILLKYAPELDRELVPASQEWLKDKIVDEKGHFGEQQALVWERYSQWLYENGQIEAMIETEQAFTNDFLPGNH